MPISLVPPETPAAEPTTMTPDQARAHLTALVTDNLKTLREALPLTKTSELIAWLVNPQFIAERIVTEADVAAKREEEVFTAAMLAIADEIDRRVPL